MVKNPRLGRIYLVLTKDGTIPRGTRVEFLGGAEDLLFSDGVEVDYFSEEEIANCQNQSPLPFSVEMERARSQGNSGFDPE